jgi:hypothetical protein
MRKIASLLVPGLLAVACAAAALAGDHDAESRVKARLVGVWHISGQPVNCQTRAPLPVPPITGIIAFHSGGTSTEAGPSATPRTPGLGTWRRTGKRQFTAAATVLNYDVNGLSTGSLVVRRVITLDEDGASFTAPTMTTITDASGVSVLRCADATATRAED